MKQALFYSLFGAVALTSTAVAMEHEAVQPVASPQCCEPVAPPPPVMANNPCCFGGFYMGAAIGYGSHKARTDQTLATTIYSQNAAPGDTATPITRSYLNDLSLDGINGGLYAGYGKEWGCSRVYLGLEAGYFFDGSKGKYTYTPTANAIGDVLRTEVKRKDGIEFAARMGWVFNQTMPYIKLGWANTKLEATQITVPHNGVAAVPGPGVDSTAQPPLTQKFLSKRVNGFLVGAGIDMKLNRCWIAGLEYTYTRYQKKRGPLQIANVAVNPATAADGWNSGVRLSDNKFRLRLTYQF